MSDQAGSDSVTDDHPSLISRISGSIGAFCFRYALAVILMSVMLAVLSGWAASSRLGFDTDTAKLIDPNLPWRKVEAEFDRAFPGRDDLLVIVIDGKNPDLVSDGARRLAESLRLRPDIAKHVREPGGGSFFRRNGVLFLDTQEVLSLSEKLIEAQPLIGSLAADPSLRGLFQALNLVLEGVKRGDADLAQMVAVFDAMTDTADQASHGIEQPLSWQKLMTGREPRAEELRRFVLVQPVLDFTDLKPGAEATEAVRQVARELGLTPERGLTVRLTGSVALNDEEFGTLADGAGKATVLSFGLVILLLWLGLRSWRLIIPIAITLLVGLACTAGFATLTVGKLNPISVAFAVMFVGIAVDFSIQYCVRYRAERHRYAESVEALKLTSRGIGAPLVLAATTTAAGFLAFTPTAYTGVSDLGIIAGAGMIIALIFNLTLLPALLRIFSPRDEVSDVGFAWAAPIDRWLVARRRMVLVLFGGVALAGMASLPFLTFDFNPLNLKDKRTESVATLLDIARDPMSSPYTISVLAPSAEAARDMANRLEEAPEIRTALSVFSFIPDDQQAKLAAIADMRMLLGPSLAPGRIASAPSPQESASAIRETIQRIRDLDPALEGMAPAMAMVRALDIAMASGNDSFTILDRALTGSLGTRLADMAEMLQAGPVAFDTLDDELRNEWISADGRSRIEVFPRGNGADNAVLTAFADAVRRIAPDATGSAITIQESGTAVVTAFVTAGWVALLVVALLLALILRNLANVLRVLAPLLLASLMTVLTCVVIGMPLNYANIIAAPLLLGIGTAFNIYFVVNWQAGIAGPLQHPTARAVMFSAFTTVSAFGSLALSNHTGTSEMGILLTLCLAYTLLTALIFLPALLGHPRPQN